MLSGSHPATLVYFCCCFVSLVNGIDDEWFLWAYINGPIRCIHMKLLSYSERSRFDIGWFLFSSPLIGLNIFVFLSVNVIRLPCLIFFTVLSALISETIDRMFAGYEL